MLFLRDQGDTEIGGFGISARNDFTLIEDIQLVDQDCTSFTVAFRDEAVADFFDEQVDAGRQPDSFGRCWIHTHPGNCPRPSAKDEETFERVFGRADWAVMFILARSGDTYGRLRFNAGPGGEIELTTKIDYESEFVASNRTAWKKEYVKSVHDRSPHSSSMIDPDYFSDQDPSDEQWYDDWLQYTEGDCNSPYAKVVEDE